jgi:hypothetical protein
VCPCIELWWCCEIVNIEQASQLKERYSAFCFEMAVDSRRLPLDEMSLWSCDCGDECDVQGECEYGQSGSTHCERVSGVWMYL